MKPKGKCFWCGRLLWRQERSRDHVDPVGVGGTLMHFNVVIACVPCNQERGQVLVNHLYYLELLDRAAAEAPSPGLERAVEKYARKLEGMAALHAKWVELEESRNGESPSRDLVVGAVEMAADNACREASCPETETLDTVP